MNDICFLDAQALSEEIAQGRLSAAEVMSATLSRIAETNPRLNAVVSLRDADRLMDEARAADAAPRHGWLHGIPIAIKDLADAEGLPTTEGSPIHAGRIAQSDELHVARLRAAGAIIIGKTNVPEFGLGSHTFNPVHGATRNPYASERSAGGSSGGAAVALAAGMLSIADGSDMMGSLRNPAGWNNVYGMRPTWGLMPPRPEADGFLHQLSTNGPMARCPRDLAALLGTMAGPVAYQPHGRDVPNLERIEPGTARIGWLGDWDGAYLYEDGIVDLCETALAQFETAGCKVDSLKAPLSREVLWDSWTTLRSFAVAAGLSVYNDDPTHRLQLSANAIWELENAKGQTAGDIRQASALRMQWYQTAATLFERFDVLALPTAQVFPFDVRENNPTQIAGRKLDTYHRWMEALLPCSLIGLPCIAVPIGFGGPDGLPMGMQLIGRPGSDAMLLEVAELWHQATNWPAACRPVT